MKVKVEAKIHPSEDPKKVLGAINNLFPTLEFELKDEKLIGESDKLESLENFKNKLGLQAIRDSARRELKKERRENSLTFRLNRQAATVDKVSFSGGNTPLGPIKVSITSQRIEELIDFLAPPKGQR